MDCIYTQGIITKMSDLISHFHQGEENFTIIPHHLFQIDYLKPDEKYLLMWFKSRPPSFRINTKSLAKNLGVGVSTIKRMSINLQANNHLFIKKSHSGHTEWHFFQYPKDCLHFSSPLKSPHVENQHEEIEKPYVEKPHVENRHVLVSIDPLVNIDLKDKTLCASNDEHIEKCFDKLWEVWPAKKNKKASKKAFKALCKGKTPNGITLLLTTLKIDVQARLNANEYAFDRRNLEKHLKNKLYEDEIKPDVNIFDNKTPDDEKQKQNANTAKWMKEQGNL